VTTIEKSNAMKRRLNSYWQRRRIDPDDIEMVSEDELEEEMPNISEFLDLPPPTWSHCLWLATPCTQ